VKLLDARPLALATVVLVGSLVMAFAALPQAGYHLLKKYELGAAPGGKEYWDYITLDTSTRRLYISHNTEVKVVDADSGAIVGSVSDLKRVHGIVVMNDLGRGFISDGGADEVVVFDLKTLKATGHIKTGGNPDCIIYDPASKHIFAMNGKTNDASVIDPAAEKVIGTIPIGGRPEYAVPDGHGTIYDNVEDKNEVVAIDLDVQHHRLFVGGRNKMLAIMNVDTGKVVQTFPIGAGVDTNIFESSTGTLSLPRGKACCMSIMRILLTVSA
jgi:YVTN family beta-propeller protein